MKVLLINPPFDYGSFEPASPRCPPLGLASLASYLRLFGHEVRIIDAFALDLNFEQIKREIGEFNPDLVGTTSVTSNHKNVMKTVDSVKEVNKKIFTVLGGPHATIMPELCLKNPKLDLVVIGEGELVFKEILERLASGKNLNKIPGTAHRNKTGVVINQKKSFIRNLDFLPMPSYDLLPMNNYKAYGIYDVGKRFTTMITSRGCPNDCSFCSSCQIWGNLWRGNSPERVVDEIEMLNRIYGINHIYFQDDEFTFPMKRMERICDLLIERDIDIIWECLTKIDYVDKELLKKMAEAGCVNIVYGVESGDPKTLRKIRKEIDLNYATKVCKWTKEAGIICRVSFMLGFPWESEKEIRKTIDFAKKLDLDFVYFNMLTPFPNTDIYQEIKNNNLFVDESEWSKYISHGKEPVIRTKYLTEKELSRLNGRAYFEVYLRPKFILKRIFAIKNPRALFRNISSGIAILKTSLKWYLSG